MCAVRARQNLLVNVESQSKTIDMGMPCATTMVCVGRSSTVTVGWKGAGSVSFTSGDQRTQPQSKPWAVRGRQVIRSSKTLSHAVLEIDRGCSRDHPPLLPGTAGSGGAGSHPPGSREARVVSGGRATRVRAHAHFQGCNSAAGGCASIQQSAPYPLVVACNSQGQ